YRNLQTGKVEHRGLVTCRNAWACPLCSEKYHRERYAELSELLARCEEKGAFLAHATLTLARHPDHRYSDMHQWLRAALHDLRNSRRWRRLMRRYKLVGTVRIVEDAHTEPYVDEQGRECGGWGPHCHLILVFEQAPDFDPEQQEFGAE